MLEYLYFKPYESPSINIQWKGKGILKSTYMVPYKWKPMKLNIVIIKNYFIAFGLKNITNTNIYHYKIFDEGLVSRIVKRNHSHY